MLAAVTDEVEGDAQSKHGCWESGALGERERETQLKWAMAALGFFFFFWWSLRNLNYTKFNKETIWIYQKKKKKTHK